MSEPSQAEVVLSAERVDVGTRRVPTERVRVRREVVTEEMTVVVTVRREVLRVERQSLDAVRGAGVDPSTAAAADAPTEPFEVVLSAERPVISLEVVPYERVRVSTRVVPTTTRTSTTAAHEVAELVRTRTA